jgi:sentrin-specific protease 7
MQQYPDYKAVASPRESMSVVSPAKRRKIYSSHNEAVPTVEILDSEEDDVQGEHPAAEPVSARARSAIASRSPHSTASRQSGTVAYTPSQPSSEFTIIDQFMQPPKRSKPRKLRANEGFADQSESHFDVPTVPAGSLSHGDASKTVPRNTVHRHEDIVEDGITSKHFQPSGSSGKMRINESTSEDYDQKDRKFAAESSIDKDLRQFRPATTHGPRHVTQYEGSEDELAAPNTSKKRDRQSPGKHTQRRTECKPGEYVLSFFQTYDSRQRQSLLQPTDNRRKFRIVSRDNGGGEKTLHILHLNQVNKVRADDTTRMRLTGSIDAKGDQYWYDLEIEDPAAFRQFRDNHAFPECSSAARFIKDP